MSYLYNISFRGLTLGLLLFLSSSGVAQVQENHRAELAHTQRMGQQFPDSAFLLLKEMYSQSLARKDRKITAITTASIIVVLLLLVVLGAVVISRQRLKIRNERLAGERDRQIDQTRQELMKAEQQNRQLQEEKLVQELEVRKKQLQQLIRQINHNFTHDQYWNEFRETFGQVHRQFFDHLKVHCEDLTRNDLRLLCLIKLDLTSGDIATLLGISQDSLRVSRYRLKKKLSLNNGESLTAFVHSL